VPPLGVPSLKELFDACDQALDGLREVVMSAIRVEHGRALFAGIGNVEIFGPDEVSRPAPSVGRIGRGVRRYREAELPIAAGHRWALASDGLRHREMRRALAGCRALAPQQAAQHLVDQLAREDDDASVLVIDFAEAAP
jgi:hypothetical protein